MVRLAVEASNNAGADLLLRQGITLALATLLRPAHLEALQPWPQRHGGARSGASVLIADVCGLLATPLAMARSRQGVVLRLQEVGRWREGLRSCALQFECSAGRGACPAAHRVSAAWQG